MEKFYKKFAFNFSDVGMALLVLISLWLNANVNAQAPTFNSTPVTNAKAGTPYNYSLFATDPGNNNITFTAPTLPSWLSFSASGQNTPTEFGMTLANPGGIVQDDDGNTYITSFSDTKIYKITPDGNSSVWANRGTGTVLSLMIHDGFMYVPYYTGGTSGLTRIAMNNPAAGESSIYSAAKIISLAQKDGYLYCASYGSGKLVRIRISDFQATDLATTGTGLLGGPFGVAFDSEGKLLIASWNGQRLQRWDGATFTTLPITFTGNLSDVKVDRAGYVYVSVYGNSTILKFTPDLSSSVTVASNMSTYSMTLSSNGTLVFGNRLDSKQYRLQTGAVLTGTPTQAHIGTHNVKITADNGTQTTDQEFIITVKGAPTVGSFADISKSIGDANFSLTAPSSNSAGAFTYTSSNIGVATISGNMVTITGAGTTTITATQAADGFYDGASVTATLTVGIKPPGNALTFDGSGDFVQIGNANTFDARNMKTIEAWVKFNDLVNEQEIISKSTSSNGLELIIYNRQLAVFAMGGGLDRHVDYPTSNLVANRWYHVAATHNGANSTLTLYLNGVVVGTAQTPTGMTNSADPLHLGKWNDPYSNRYFKGSLDEVRIWNVQLTQAQIQAGMYQEIDPATAGLQAYYKFSEGIADGNNTAITTTLDATANTRNGILNGFAKTGSASNYTESYALVAPVLQDAADITGEGFTAKWQTPITGVVDNYLLDVSESSNFSSFVPGYLNKDVGNVNEFAVTGLTANRTYYFRVRANKTSVNTQGTYSNVKTAATTKSNQTITFADLTAKTYGDASFTLSATSTSNLTVTFESSDETIASVSGTTVTIKKAGTVNIIAKQAGNSLYNAASNVTKQLVVNKAPLTVTAQNATKTYDKVAYTGGNGISYAGFITGDNAANSIAGTVVYGGTSQNAINVASNYTVIPSGLTSANYAITYANGTLTINKAPLTVTAQNATKTYDKVAYTGGNGISYTGFITGDNAANSVTGTIVYGGTSQNAINVANNYTIIPSGLSSDNYVITYANGTLAINKATLTVTAQNATKTYDKVAYTGGNDVTYAGFIASDNVANSTTGTINYSGTSQGAIAANTYTIIPSGLSSDNYVITYANGTLAINKATLTVTAQNATKTYDKVAYTGGNDVTYAGFIASDNVANSTTGTINYSGTSQGAIAANTYTIIPSGLSS
ncbi:LamG-like jellyroll fold domain-containing protein, partial [Pedobacter chitinilyticus]